jgi:hypothetical protein
VSNEELVFCMGLDEGEYVMFLHEADVLLHALGQEVAEKKITSAQAREVYTRYYDVDDTYIIDPEDVEEEVADLREMAETNVHYTSEKLQRDLESLVGEYGNFPRNEESDHLPNSSTFWEEAAELDIPGAGFSKDESPASGPIFEVDSADALLNLREEMQGKCRIVVRDDVTDYAGENSEEARRFIEETRKEQLSG